MEKSKFKLKDGLEILKVTIDEEFQTGDEDLGVSLISYTATPAILQRAVNFSEQINRAFQFKDDVKMRIAGPILIPMDIYRNDDWGEYYVQFEREEIEKIFVKFMRNLNNNTSVFNLEHTDEISPSFVLEAWMVGDDNKGDRSFTEFGIECKPGSVFVISQVTDKEYYDKLIKEDAIGYSIEGFLGFKMSEMIKNKANKMSKTNVLPDGEHRIQGSVYTVKLGQIINVKLAEEEEEEVKLEDKKEELEDEKKEEMESDKKEEMEDKEEELEEKEELEEEEVKEEEKEEKESEFEIDEEALMLIIQPKLDEIYEMIAEIKAGIEGKSEEEMEEDEKSKEPVQMSLHQRFSGIVEHYLKK